MFCPPPVREKYMKKYGKKRVEEYERRMLRRQQKQQQQQNNNIGNGVAGADGGETTDDTPVGRIPSRKLTRFLRSGRKDGKGRRNGNKNQSRRVIDDESDKEVNMSCNQTGSTSPTRWTEEDSKALQELGENGKTFVMDDENDDDESHLDDEFHAYSSGSSCSSHSSDSDHDNDNDNHSMDEMYRDSDDSNDEELEGPDSKSNSKHSNNKNLWSAPAAIRQANNDNNNRKTHQQLTSKPETSQNTNKANNNNTTNSNNNSNGNIFGLFVNAFQGMSLFHGSGNNNNSQSQHIEKESPTLSLPNNDITSVSKEEQQKRASELLSALGLFGVASFDQHQSSSKNDITPPAKASSSSSIAKQLLVPDLEPTESSTSDHRFDSTPTKRVTPNKSFDDDVNYNKELNAVQYFGGTYEDDEENDDNYNNNHNSSEARDEEYDQFHDAVSVELSSINSSSYRRGGRAKRSIVFDSSQSVHSTASNHDKEKSILNMDISVLAHTFAVSRNILDEACQPSPKQKRMLISHYAQLQRKKTTKQEQQMRKKLAKKNIDENEDEIVDIDDEEEGTSNSDSCDEEEDNSGECKEDSKALKKGDSKSGVNHVGSEVFLATQRRSKYYGSSSTNGSIITFNSRSSYSRRGCRSVTSLSNIDEDSVVEISDDNNGIPMVNRLLLTPASPGTVWEDNHGKIVTNRTYTNVIPDFKPRLEEDDIDDDSAEKSTDSDDNNNLVGRSHHSDGRNDDDSKTAVSSSSSSRISTSFSTPKRNASPGSTNPGSETPFCFGGILLATPSHFNPSPMEEINSDAISVSSETSRRSTASTLSRASNFSKSSKKKKNVSSSLVSLIHPMNKELFADNNMRTETLEGSPTRKRLTITPRKTIVRADDYGCDELKSPRGTVSTAIVEFTPKKCSDSAPLFNAEQYEIFGQSPSTESRSRLASSFRSSAVNNEGRVAYNLSGGKKSMTKDERMRVQAMLPNRPVFSAEDLGLVLSPTDRIDNQSKDEKKTSDKDGAVFNLGDSRKRLSLSGHLPLSPSTSDDTSSLALARTLICKRNCTIAVLLIEPTIKIFEVVFLEDLNVQETTVGEVLAKVRSNAIDPALSEQKYNSLCNEDQELAAPMLPVEYLLANTVGSQNANETPLLVAVPVGSTAFEMQSIKKILWSNPKTARWWEQKDPTRPVIRSKTRLESSLTTDENSENKIQTIHSEASAQPSVA